jgi:membrane protein implicated in regulation of membrane protease activity
MSRPLLALLLGLVGFATYVGAVVVVADWILPLHWLVQLAYFALAGVAWVWPARALMFWAARAG